MVSYGALGKRQPNALWERSLTGSHYPREANFKHLGEVIRLTDRWPFPVDICIYAMQVSAVSRHLSHHQLHPSVRSCQMTSQPFPVCKSFPYTSPSYRLFCHSRPDRPRLTRHRFILGNVGHQSNLSEQENTYAEVPLKPFWVPQPNETIVWVEYSQATPHRISHLTVDNRVIIHISWTANAVPHFPPPR